MQKKIGVSKISCVIVAVVGFIYFWRKMKAFQPLERRRCDKIQFYQKKNGSHHQLPVSEHYISHNMCDMLVFLMILRASTKKIAFISVLAILCGKKTTQV